jgi:Flp pilus assembly protein TadG
MRLHLTSFLPNSLRRLARDRRGATAVEFAMVAPLFFALVFSVFETGWVMTQTVMLERSLDRTVRHLRVGGANAPKTYDAFVTQLCNETLVIPNCRNRILVEMFVVRAAGDFPAEGAQSVSTSSQSNTTPVYRPDNRSDVLFVRACVVIDPMTPGIGVALALPRDPQAGFRVVAASAYMNEPG